MKAIAAIPGKRDSIHLAQLPRPHLDEVPEGRPAGLSSVS
jgi:hypothetical protein